MNEDTVKFLEIIYQIEKENRIKDAVPCYYCNLLKERLVRQLTNSYYFAAKKNLSSDEMKRWIKATYDIEVDIDSIKRATLEEIGKGELIE